jgi:hypothetical protein
MDRAGATVVVSRSTIARVVARANIALSTSFSAIYRITTHCGRQTCTGTAEVWQRSKIRFVWQYAGGEREIVGGTKGLYTCQRDPGTSRWACLHVMGMGPSTLESNYPPVLLADDLSGLSLTASGVVHLTDRSVRGRHAQCLVFGPARLPSATACVGPDGLIVYLSTSIEPDNGFDGTVEMTSFGRSVPSSVFELPGPVSDLG